MKLISFNINSIRAHFHQLEALKQNHAPEIIGLQEIKVIDDAFPRGDVQDLGYHSYSHGQKTHHGVALLSSQEAVSMERGWPGEDADAQRRTIIGVWESKIGPIKVINGYFPQGESREHPTKFPAKREYYQNLNAYLRNQCSPSDNLVVMGDLNISPTDRDIGIGPDNAKRWLRTGKCSFLPEERAWLQDVLDWGLYDSFRELNPKTDDRFSWFDYRSRGFSREPKRGLRIDAVLLSKPLMERCKAVGIDYDNRAMEKPSDHAPVWAELDL